MAGSRKLLQPAIGAYKTANRHTYINRLDDNRRFTILNNPDLAATDRHPWVHAAAARIAHLFLGPENVACVLATCGTFSTCAVTEKPHFGGEKSDRSDVIGDFDWSGGDQILEKPSDLEKLPLAIRLLTDENLVERLAGLMTELFSPVVTIRLDFPTKSLQAGIADVTVDKGCRGFVLYGVFRIYHFFQLTY